MKCRRDRSPDLRYSTLPHIRLSNRQESTTADNRSSEPFSCSSTLVSDSVEHWSVDWDRSCAILGTLDLANNPATRTRRDLSLKPRAQELHSSPPGVWVIIRTRTACIAMNSLSVCETRTNS